MSSSSSVGRACPTARKLRPTLARCGIDEMHGFRTLRPAVIWLARLDRRRVVLFCWRAERARTQCWFRMHARWQRLAEAVDRRGALWLGCCTSVARQLGRARCTSFCAEAAQHIRVPAKPSRRHAIFHSPNSSTDARCTACAEALDASSTRLRCLEAARLRMRLGCADAGRPTQINACFSCFPSPRQCHNAAMPHSPACRCQVCRSSPSLPLPYVSQKRLDGRRGCCPLTTSKMGRSDHPRSNTLSLRCRCALCSPLLRSFAPLLLCVWIRHCN